jgi:hypothetical protein
MKASRGDDSPSLRRFAAAIRALRNPIDRNAPTESLINLVIQLLW